ncbi:hypothetical protein EV183_000203 [Coemansia sp. RSA 2336]|nr:hypothetical protein EV183_000203 [Coemansia sp. RSA 2336]
MKGHKADLAKDCELVKLVQYRFCKPFERLFKRCPGVPMVEMVPVNGTCIDIKSLNNLVDWQGFTFVDHEYQI